MKIVFICGSVETGKCGVGDYARILSNFIIQEGYEAELVSVYDKHIKSKKIDYQVIAGTKVKATRIPKSITHKERFKILQEYLNIYKPDWVSIQYVPYSFNSKGIPVYFPKFLGKLKGQHQWHIMFHELWLGINIEASLKNKLVGLVQKHIVKKLVESIHPTMIHTQQKLYQLYLKNNNIAATVLSLHSNIPKTTNKSKHSSIVQFVLFGLIRENSPFEAFIEKVNSEIEKSVKFIFIGKSGNQISNCIEILNKYNIAYDTLGFQDEKTISKVLANSNYGISTTPFYQSDKSGAIAAYKEHGIETICVAGKWTPKYGTEIKPNYVEDFKTFDFKKLNPKKIISKENSNYNEFINRLVKA